MCISHQKTDRKDTDVEVDGVDDDETQPPDDRVILFWV